LLKFNYTNSFETYYIQNGPRRKLQIPTMSLITDNLRVLIVADDPLARAGLATLLANYPVSMVVNQVPADTDWLTGVDVYRPDVIVWDLGWNPTLNLDRLVNLQEVELPVVALLPDEAHAAEVWAAGVHSLLFRDTNADRLLAALLATAQGLTTLEPELAAGLTPDKQPEAHPLAEALTPREIEVLQLLAEGLPNKTIARQLGISEHTVKFHVNAIFGKLGVQSRTEAVVRATRLGLLLL
jgi:DNA-binding NarL/FixJ family response regulator